MFVVSISGRRLRLRAVLFALPLLLCACAGDRDGGGENAVFTDPAGYRLSVPDGWRVTDRTERGELIRADIDGGKQMGIQVRLAPVAPARFSATVKAMLDDYRRDMTGHWGGEMTETGRCSPDAGEEALTVRFRARRKDGKEWYLQESFVRSGEKLLVLQGGCPWPRREAAARAFDSILESVAFTGSAGR